MNDTKNIGPLIQSKGYPFISIVGVYRYKFVEVSNYEILGQRKRKRMAEALP